MVVYAIISYATVVLTIIFTTTKIVKIQLLYIIFATMVDYQLVENFICDERDINS